MADQDEPRHVLVVEERPEERARLADLATRASGLVVSFADNGHQALAQMEFHRRVDVLVTRSSASRSEGLHLLAETRLRMPAVGRVLVVTGEDLSNTGHELSHANEVLRGPLDIDAVAAFAHRQARLRHHSDDIVRLVGGIDALPSPPKHIAMLNEAVSNPDMTMDHVAEALERDVAATAKLLSLVNSAYFGLPHRVKSVQHALAYLGLETTRNLIGALELVSAAGRAAPDLKPHVEMVHAHSMKVATHSRRLAERTHYVHDAFAAGLLHDIGILVLLGRDPDKFRALCADPTDEVAILGAAHGEIGAALLAKWGLPWTIVDAVARSHDADSTIDPVANTAHAVFVAEQVTGLVDNDAMPWELARMPANSYLDSVRARESVLELVGQRIGR